MDNTGPARRTVVIAPDSYGGTLAAVEAARAIATGWAKGSDGDELDQVPLSDGGPGFVEVLAGAVSGGSRVSLTVAGPLGGPVAAEFLVAGDTAYVESAAAAGLHLLAGRELDPWAASTYGVGELLAAALARPAVSRVVVGLGGSATTDGGRGLVEALGGVAAARAATARVELVAATDVDNPLLGPAGAAAVFAPQKGANPEQVGRLERRLAEWADVLADDHDDIARLPGAGAAGGLGFALLALGARRVSGGELVAKAVRLPERLTGARLVVTGEGRLDAQSVRGKVVASVAGAAMAAGVPCVALAGEVELGRREAAAYGISESHGLVTLAGSPSAAREHAARWLAELAERVAARWRPVRR